MVTPVYFLGLYSYKCMFWSLCLNEIKKYILAFLTLILFKNNNFILLISYWWIFQTHKIKYGDLNQNRSHQSTVSKPKKKCFQIFITETLSIDLTTSARICFPEFFFKFTIELLLLPHIILFSWQKNNSTGAMSWAYCGRNMHVNSFSLKNDFTFFVQWAGELSIKRYIWLVFKPNLFQT